MNKIKAEMRKQLREEIAALPDDYIADSDNGLLLGITALKEFIASRNIMIYCSVEREPGSREIIKAALSMKKTVALPYCYRGGIMQARVINNLDELRPAMLGIPAPPDAAPVLVPEELDFIVVPALTYDMMGYRLGYGGGYYDRYLSGVRAFKAGLARERLLKEALPREDHDIAVDCIITEIVTRQITVMRNA